MISLAHTYWEAMDRDSQKKRSCCRELRDVESCSSAEFREASNWFGGRNNGKYRLVLRMHGEQNMLTKLARIAKLWCETLRRRIILQQGLRNSLDCAPPLCATLFCEIPKLCSSAWDLTATASHTHGTSKWPPVPTTVAWHPIPPPWKINFKATWTTWY